MYLNASAAQPNVPHDQILDLSRVIRLGRRHLRLMAVIFLAIVAVTAAATLMMRPVYTASVQLMIDKPREKLLAKDGDNNGADLSQTTLDASAVETELQVLRSPALAESVVSDLQLDRDPEFNPALAPPSAMARVKGFVASLTARKGATTGET